ncbi:hypothetical protein R3P38DRAFT_2857247 [Favolaschia claudopus]|uniref:C2H2-type domain-containing protein n=1 Tax=Favolaschia claudopus TaxID=2862362 RepID=A0AAW0DFR0_9AGAR
MSVTKNIGPHLALRHPLQTGNHLVNLLNNARDLSLATSKSFYSEQEIWGTPQQTSPAVSIFNSKFTDIPPIDTSSPESSLLEFDIVLASCGMSSNDLDSGTNTAEHEQFLRDQEGGCNAAATPSAYDEFIQSALAWMESGFGLSEDQDTECAISQVFDFLEIPPMEVNASSSHAPESTLQWETTTSPCGLPQNLLRDNELRASWSERNKEFLSVLDRDCVAGSTPNHQRHCSHASHASTSPTPRPATSPPQIIASEKSEDPPFLANSFCSNGESELDPGSFSDSELASDSKTNGQRTFRGRRKASQSSHYSVACTVPLGLDLEKVANFVPSLHTRGQCNWNGCTETIDLTRKEVSAHMKDAHGVPNSGAASKHNPRACLWPLCNGKFPNENQKRQSSLLRHLRMDHFPTQHVACPYCKRVYVSRKNLKRHFEDAKQFVRQGWAP